MAKDPGIPWFWMRQQGPQDTGRPINLFSQGLETSVIRFNFFHTAQIMHEAHSLLRHHGLKHISSALKWIRAVEVNTVEVNFATTNCEIIQESENITNSCAKSAATYPKKINNFFPILGRSMQEKKMTSGSLVLSFSL